LHVERIRLQFGGPSAFLVVVGENDFRCAALFEELRRLMCTLFERGRASQHEHGISLRRRWVRYERFGRQPRQQRPRNRKQNSEAESAFDCYSLHWFVFLRFVRVISWISFRQRSTKLQDKEVSESGR
jgi:hypothetical protein